MKASIGICAYNEEKNVGKLIEALLKQRMPKRHEIKEIFVVASGCTDRTEEITKKLMKKSKRIKLISQKEKRGKASAINLFLKKAKGDILILQSADTLPANANTIYNLIKPFKDKKIGMSGGCSHPINDRKKFMGFTVHLVWGLHHLIALESPKLGEIVAFRNLVKSIPEDTAVDEAAIEAQIEKKGYKLAYAADAIIDNKGPETLKDFIKQRKRIYIGHMHLKKTQYYSPSTENKLHVLKVLIKQSEISPKKLLWTCFAVALDVYIRLLAITDFYLLRRNPYNWQVSKTTKDLKK
ncbi:glycosyltransferase [Candidatus Undinarchaeota archaeon]